MQKEKVFENYLKELFPIAYCELNFNTTFELLVAVILSAQCTDKRVNMVTNELFKKYNKPEQFAKMPVKQLETIIKPCGFYHNKAKNIIEASKIIVKEHNGNVPNTYNNLLSLPGVGRKTANVVSSIAFGNNVVAVDTHVLRVSNRLTFSQSKNPDVCEKDLTCLFKNNLTDLHYRMVLFGRYKCKAKKPLCDDCKMKSCCNYFKSEKAKNNKEKTTCF